jgi:protein SCO1/2
MDEEMAVEMEAVDPAHNMSIYQVSSDWTTQDGERVKLGNLAGKTRVAAMAYTSCEVACPRIVASMKRIQKKAHSAEVGFVLISIDPERDTPAALKAYARKMNLDESDWILLTGSPDDVLELAALLGVRYRKMADGEFAHSNIITVLNVQGEIVYQQNGLGADLTAETAEFVSSM